MTLSEHAVAGLSLAGSVCDMVGALYLAYDVFRRHAGPLGLLTRAVTYSLVMALPGWGLLGLAFAAIAGSGLGGLIAFDQWRLSRHQRLQLSSPLTQSAWAGAARGMILGLACVPDHGLRFGLAASGCAGGLAGLLYGAGLVPTYRPYRGGGWLPPRHVIRAAFLRGLALGAGVVAAGALVGRGGTAGAGATAALGLELAGLIALVSILIALVAPVVEFWIENAGDSFFVYAGLSLLFCGLVLDSIPHIAVLLR
jgi:hypothetical protein